MEQRDQAAQIGLTLRTYSEILKVGRENPSVEVESPQPSTCYMFCYTSGTTGDPKGVMLSHQSFVSCAHFVDCFKIDINESDTNISYLPYGHTFEQCLFIFSLLKGFSHGYYSGDPLKLLDDIQTLKPTMFCTVPRILNKVYTKIQDSISQKSAFA